MQNKGTHLKIEGSKKIHPIRNIKKIYNFGTFSYN
jgi:hypothetical protein